MKKILKNVLLFSALIGSVNCLALPAAAVDVATATSYMETTDDSKYPSSGTCASGATWTFDYRTRELHIRNFLAVKLFLKKISFRRKISSMNIRI